MNGRNHKGRPGYLTGIVILKNFSTGAIEARKYRNIRNAPASLRRFEEFAGRIRAQGSGVMHINYYFADTRNFSHQTRYNQQSDGIR